MRSTADTLTGSAPTAPPPAVYLNIAWNLVVMVGSVILAVFIFGLDDFGRLGKPVQVFVGLLALVPALLAIYSGVMLLQRKPGGRYAALLIDYTGMVIAIVALLTLWGVWDTFEIIVDGIMQAPWVLLFLVLTYSLNWMAARVGERSPLHDPLQTAALAIAALTLAMVLWFSGIAAGVWHVIGTYTRWSVWLATIAVLVSGGLGWRMLHLGTFFGESPFEREAWQGWLMLSPNIFGFLVFFAGPLLLSFYLSFTDSTVGQVPNVTWFQNYAEILALQLKPIGDAANAQVALGFEYDVLTTFNLFGAPYVLGAQDTLFWRSLGNTMLFVLMLVPLSTIPAIIMALVLNANIPGMKFFRAVYFLPSVAAVVGTALIWRWLYDPTIGFINYAISGIVGFLQAVGVPANDPSILWLSDPGVVLVAIVLLASWQVVGFNTVLFLAGLQGIPNVLYEAAKIDGAGGWARFRNVTLPLLGPTTFFVITTTIIQGLQVFNEPYTLFPARPIPINATTSVYYLYQRGFFHFEFGYASAVAWMLFGIIFLITFIQFRIQRADAYE